MGKTVEKIVINTESIDIVSVENGVNSIVQLGLEAQEDSIKDIFEKYNLNNIINYPFDEKIVRALSENEEQLDDYLQVCRQAAYSKGKIKIPDSIPNIEYDFRELKNGIAKVSEGEQKSKQIEMYKQAKQTQDTFRSSKGKVDILMGIVDKAYFTVQAFLQNRNKNQVKALNPGKMEARRSIRDELKNREYTEKTNEVSREYKEALEQKEMAAPVVDKESGEQEIDEMINL